MHRAVRGILFAAAVAVTAPVALAGAEPATGDGPAPAVPAPTANVRAAASVAEAALEEARTPPPASVVRVLPGRSILLRSRPGGPRLDRLGDTTDFGSARKLGVVRRRGTWLGVTTPTLPNGRLGWIDSRSPAIALSRTAWSLHADISDRTLVLRRAGRPVRRLSVAVGRAGSPTPTGRFAVTDKISGGRFGPYYGCCILAISATQPNTPPGWTGGNRMAIHGTDAPGSIGAAASAGCLRAADADLSVLMEKVPVGTPVTIRP
jgi:hypothetical protein